MLEAWLARTARARSLSDVVLVWDGRASGRASRPPSPLKVIYTSKNETADERILALCRGRYAGRGAGTWVVSSDREVQGRARQLGFGVLGAMTFYRRWERREGSGRERGAAPPVRGASDKPLHASRAEVEDLLRNFLDRSREED